MGREGRFKGRATPDERAESLKEAVYVSFTILAVLLANAMHGHVDALGLALVVAVTTIALTITMFTADLIAHLAVHEHAPTGAQWRHALRAAVTPLLVAVPPIVILLLGSLGWWTAEGAVVAAIVAVLVALASVGWLALRGAASGRWRKLMMLALLIALICGVVALQLLAHA